MGAGDHVRGSRVCVRRPGRCTVVISICIPHPVMAPCARAAAKCCLQHFVCVCVWVCTLLSANTCQNWHRLCLVGTECKSWLRAPSDVQRSDGVFCPTSQSICLLARCVQSVWWVWRAADAALLLSAAAPVVMLHCLCCCCIRSRLYCLCRCSVLPRPQMGGSESLINALIRGLKKHGGRLQLRSHVDKIVVEGGRAVGVALRPRVNGNNGNNGASSSSSSSEPEFIRARKGVISNASVWDTQKLLAPGVGPREWRREAVTTPAVS